MLAQKLGLLLQRLFAQALLVITLLFCAMSQSYADDADELVKKLKLLDTFTGQFVQTLTGDKGELLQESSGDFILQRPGYFRWNTTEPFPQLLVANLETIWLYDPDLEQVAVREYDDNVSATPALLLSGDVRKIKRHYHIQRHKQQNTHPTNGSLNEATYLLTPVTPQELFVSLNVTFVDNQIVSMHLVDALGQVTQFQFVEGVYNQAVDGSMFEFSPPEGADVIIEK